jgi:hypothetical protein
MNGSSTFTPPLWLNGTDRLPPASLTLPPPEVMLALDWLAAGCWPAAAAAAACVPDADWRTEIRRRVPEIGAVYTAHAPLPPDFSAARCALFLPDERHLHAAAALPPANHSLLIVAAGALIRFLPPLVRVEDADASAHRPISARACLRELRRQRWPVHDVIYLHGERAVLWSLLLRAYRRCGRDDLAACAMIRTREQYRGVLTGTLALIRAGGTP